MMRKIERAPKRYVREGERVAPGGPVYCRKSDPKRPGVTCGGYVGGPPVGARLEFVSQPGELVGECEESAVSIRCERCRRQYLFTLRKAA